MINDLPYTTLEDFIENSQAIIEIIEEEDIPCLHLGSKRVEDFVMSPPFLSYLSLHLAGFCDIIIVNQKEK